MTKIQLNYNYETASFLPDYIAMKDNDAWLKEHSVIIWALDPKAQITKFSFHQQITELFLRLQTS